jgi:toxin ParE1/3/4
VTARYTLSPRAPRDLDEIWTYTGGRWGIDQAELYTRRIAHDIRTVAETPTIGRGCPDIRAGYYKYPTGSHVLFYHRTAEGIDVVRILHKRMDVRRHV